MMLTEYLLFDLFFLVLAAFIAVLAYFKHSYKYWKKKGIPYLEPSFPYGNSSYLLSRAPTITGEVKAWYDELKARGHKFGGAWSLSRKVLVLVDPDYIKDILTLDFAHFKNRDLFVNERYDPLGTSLANIRDPNWKPLRIKLTPVFTSGKMKMMFETMVDCSEPMIECMRMGSDNKEDIEIREVLASFTIDVIGSVAFGVQCNSFDRSHNEFRKQKEDIFTNGLCDYFKFFLVKCFPDVATVLRIKTGKSKPQLFFANFLKQNMEYRIKYGINRKDFLQLLMDANQETTDTTQQLTFEQMVANTVLFYMAGFDTSTSAMTFTLFELAKNPDIQDKVRQEINKVLKKHNEQITYESIMEMTYLRQVLDEALRLYPVSATLGRICTKDYKLRDTNIIIEKDTLVVISTLGLGRDPEHYPDPENFDPDRFSPEEKAKRHPYVHLPFGEGPRSCIGMRFGVMQSKLGLVKILTNFKLSISPKTKMPLELDEKLFFLKEASPLYLLAERI